MSSEKFCLRWNDFERNISAAFKDIREDREFFDVTIACEDEQLQAHKVILSACSPFFKKILRRNQHQNPLLYLKGVSHKDMESVLNFMYYGEVNVAQDDLNSFLQVAEDLRIKGLTQNNRGDTSDDTNIKPHHDSSNAESRLESKAYDSKISTPASANHHINHSQSLGRAVSSRSGRAGPEQTTLNDVEEVPVVKAEPREQLQSMAVVEEGINIEMENEQYDDSYVAEYDDQGYGYGNQYQEGQMLQGGAGNKQRCELCSKDVHPRALKRHMQTVHSVDRGLRYSCSICNTGFKSDMYLKDHMRKLHNIYQSHQL